jgi:hypothetical protein
MHSSQCEVFAAISVCTPQWINEGLAGYQEDSDSLSMIAKLAIDPTAVTNFSLKNGILRYNGRIWIGKNSNMQNKLLHAYHSSAIDGHSGVPVAYARMRQLFAWQGMKSVVHSL